jgi:hypothetical protein
MAFSDYTESTEIIANLGTDPEDRPDMTDPELKAKFDENAAKLKAWLNGTHKTETQAALDAKDDALISFIDDTASRTLALTDAKKKLRANHASVAIDYTVPPNSSVAFPIGTWIIIEMTGAAQVAVAAGSGVTIKPASKLKVNGQDTSAVLLKENTDIWSFQGSVKA